MEPKAHSISNKCSFGILKKKKKLSWFPPKCQAVTPFNIDKCCLSTKSAY